jgi:hypothetical protein
MNLAKKSAWLYLNACKIGKHIGTNFFQLFWQPRQVYHLIKPALQVGLSFQLKSA